MSTSRAVGGRWTLADVRYDAMSHRSWLPDGTEIPHVTAVLSAVGVAVDFDVLMARNPRLAATVELAGVRGIAVHADCHAYDDDDLEWATVDARVRPYLEAWALCRVEKELEPLTRERRVFHPEYLYAGILDGIVRVAQQRNVLIDLKTGDPENSGARYQTAAYEAAYLALHPDSRIDERWAVWLRPGRVPPYSITNYSASLESWQDVQHFLAFLDTYRHQAERRT